MSNRTSRAATPRRSGPSSRPTSARRGGPTWTAAVLAATALLLPACSSDDAEPVATAPTTTVPAPGGQDVAELDVCEVAADPAAAFLGRVDAAPVDRVEGDTTGTTSVCGWFLAAADVAEPGQAQMPVAASLVIQVEPVLEGGNPMCEPREWLEVDPLGGDGDELAGWISTSSPVEAAGSTDDWCVYVRTPQGGTSPELPAATAELVGGVHAQLPR